MLDDSSHSKWLLLAGLLWLTISPAGAQTPKVPALTETLLSPSAEDYGEFGPPTGFGAAVAISGDTAIVGVPASGSEATETSPAVAGRVDVFTRGSANTWTRTASLLPSDRQPNEYLFGDAVALANHTLIIASSSAVRIYVQQDGTWKLTTTLALAVPLSGFNALPSANIAFDGHYLALVANSPDSGGTGSNHPFLLYLYRIHTGGQPELLGTLSPESLSPGGIVLANGILAVKGQDSSGAGLVYVYSADSATPTVPQILRSGAPTPDSSFGSSIAIWDRTILVGAPGAYLQPNAFTGGYFSGAAYVFAPRTQGWVQTQQIVPNNSAGFGAALAVNAAGALISAPYSDDNYGVHIVGDTQVYGWQNEQLVFVENISSAATSIASSGTEAILGTTEWIRYGFYESADILSVTPGSSR